MGRGKHIAYSADELAWIGANCKLPRAELHERFVKTWGRIDVTYDNIKALCTRRKWAGRPSGRFQKGTIPPNKGKKGYHAPGSEKGWFKKGHARSGKSIELYKPIGTERVTRDGYVSRKVNDDMPLHKRWAPVHRLNWEAANGPIPEGHRLKCLDGNKQNVDPSNWEAVPFALGTRLAGIHGRDYDNAPAELKPSIMAAAKLAQAISDIKKGKKHG